MRAHIAMLATAMVFVGAGTASAETVTMNVINASGVGKVIGTIGLSDANEGLVVMPDLAELPPGDHGFHVHVNPDCGPGAGPDSQPQVWRPVDIMIRSAPASTSDRTVQGTKATSRRCVLMPAATP